MKNINKRNKTAPEFVWREKSASLAYWPDTGMLVLKKVYRNNKGQYCNSNKIQMDIRDFVAILKVIKPGVEKLEERGEM